MGGYLFKNRESWRGDIYNRKYYDLRQEMHQKELANYRNGYPGKEDDPNLNDNYLFYTNKIPSQPQGDYIDNILANWWGDYKKLERHHGYIQWLFPLRERGFNREAQILQGHEAEAIKNDPEASDRFLKAYFMMLDFYGIKAMSVKEGILERGDNFEERWASLRESTHNFLRITRILKSMGEMGLERYKYGFVYFLFDEVMLSRTLLDGIESLHDYWIATLKESRQRECFYQRFKFLVKNDPEAYDRREKAHKKREEEEKRQQQEQQRQQELQQQQNEGFNQDKDKEKEENGENLQIC